MYLIFCLNCWSVTMYCCIHYFVNIFSDQSFGEFGEFGRVGPLATRVRCHHGHWTQVGTIHTIYSAVTSTFLFFCLPDPWCSQRSSSPRHSNTAQFAHPKSPHRKYQVLSRRAALQIFCGAKSFNEYIKSDFFNDVSGGVGSGKLLSYYNCGKKIDFDEGKKLFRSRNEILTNWLKNIYNFFAESEAFCMSSKKYKMYCK